MDLTDQLRDLVDMAAVRCRPAAPLIAIDRAQVAIRVGPLIPDRDAVFLQISDIGRAGQKPDQLMNDGFEMQLLGRDQREAFLQIKTHLVTENRARAGAGTVGFGRAMLIHMAHEIEVLAHEWTPGKGVL